MYSTNIEVTTNEIYFASHTRFDSIIWGCISALMIYKNHNKFYSKILNSRWSIFIGLVMILFSLLYRDVMFRESVRYTIQALAFCLIIPSINCYSDDTILKQIFNNKPFVFIGKLSYSLYLFHWISIRVANNFFNEFSLKWLGFVFMFAIILSISSYYLVERPFISLRKKFGSNVK